MRKHAGIIAVTIVFAVGAACIVGAVTTYRDSHSGTPGKARVASCTGGNGKYNRAIHCTGTWVVGGPLLDGGRVAWGSIQGAGRGDVGKTIDVRIHGSDHATVPGIGTPIALGVVGLLALALWAFAFRGWWRTRAGFIRTG